MKLAIHPGPDSVIHLFDVTVRRGEAVLLDSVRWNVGADERWVILGPNGAGKTTTLRCLLGLIHPDAGTLKLFGRDVSSGASAREGVAGFVETPQFYPYLSGQANLRLAIAYDEMRADRDEVRRVLGLVGLLGRERDKAGGYSYGMRQRLGIAAALLRSPRLLVLDEPTLGLDPAGMRDMRALIHQLASDGITVLLSSHLMNEVEQLCTRVCVIARGRSVYEGTINDLKRSASGRFLVRTRDDAAAERICRTQPGITSVEPAADGVRFVADQETVEGLVSALSQSGVPPRALVPEEEALESLFLRLTEPLTQEGVA